MENIHGKIEIGAVQLLGRKGNPRQVPEGPHVHIERIARSLVLRAVLPNRLYQLISEPFYLRILKDGQYIVGAVGECGSDVRFCLQFRRELLIRQNQQFVSGLLCSRTYPPVVAEVVPEPVLQVRVNGNKNASLGSVHQVLFLAHCSACS